MRGNLTVITLFNGFLLNALRVPSEMSPRRKDGGLAGWRPTLGCSREKVR